MPKKIVAVDSQRLDGMQFCSFFYNTKFNRNLVPSQVPEYLERGGLIHEMLSTYYKLKKYRQRWGQNKKTYADIIDSCINVGRYFGNKMQLDVAEVLYTIEIFKQYTSYWENDDWNNIVSVERVGSKVLFEDDDIIILYEGKIDLVLKIGNELIPIDHKHSGSRRDPNQLANQFKGYCWLLGTNNCIVNEIGFQKTVDAKDKFRRHTISYSDNIISEWINNTVLWIKHQLGLEELGLAPRNYTSCDKYSGCDYKHICLSDPGEFREFKLHKDFVERIWDVGGKHL